VLAVVWVVVGLGVRRAATVLAMEARMPGLRAASAHLPEGHARKLPYGVAMAAGLAAAAWFPQLLP
jgi:Flp pilus assembly protein protease CpaA